MGTAIPFPVDGVACPLCWARYKPFFNHHMPKYVQATIFGVLKGPDWNPVNPDPPNGLFELTQDAACRWRCVTVNYHMTWSLIDIGSIFDYNEAGWLGIFDGSDIPCSYEIDNNAPSWPNIWHSGHVSITWIGGP